MNFKKMVGNQVRVRALAQITAKSYFFADKNKLSSPSLKWMKMRFTLQLQLLRANGQHRPHSGMDRENGTCALHRTAFSQFS